MVTVEIEKEIDQENKIIMGFTFRQLICVSIACILAIVCLLIFDWNLDIASYPVMVIAAVAGAFGWYHPNGMKLEQVIFKALQTSFYGSNKRKYKTRNQYVAMMNAEYKRRQAIDTADKKLMKEQRKEKRVKKTPSSIKPVA